MITSMKWYTRLFLIATYLVLLTSCSTKKIASIATTETILENSPRIHVSNLFMDHMVLQQNDHVSIFGKAGKHQRINVKGSWGESARTFSDDNGDWLAKINTPSAGGPFTLDISQASQTIQINDVMVGEVWLASGQSNMQMPVKGWPPNDLINHSEKEILSGNYPQIRMFTVARNITANPHDDLNGKWDIASPETVADFSATAYFFARRLYQELNVPVGIIHTSWGGTVAEAWISKEKLSTLGDFDEALSVLSEPSSETETAEWFSNKESKAVPSTAEGYADLDLNDQNAAISTFEGAYEISLPGRFDLVEKSDMDGAFWMYKEVIIEDRNQDYSLEFGAIDDIDATYINGQKVGGISGYNLRREYAIPKSVLRRGKNLIAIRAIDTGGPGTVSEPMNLLSKNGESISLSGTWLSVPAAEIHNGKFYIYDMDENISNSRPKILKQNPNVPTVLYNAMIHPIIPYGIKGAIWYQGESNVGRDQQYNQLFPLLIKDWRQRWGSQFPFYYVQIAPFKYGGGNKNQSQKIRESQRKALRTQNTGMVVTMDIGNHNNIHPGNKQDVGKRLASLALANNYGKDIIASGPNYKSNTIDGNSIIVEFENIGSGLMSVESGLSGFELAGKNGIFKPAKAIIKGNHLVIKSNEVISPIHVRYAWSDTSHATLFNKEGLPASTFNSKN